MNVQCRRLCGALGAQRGRKLPLKEGQSAVFTRFTVGHRRRTRAESPGADLNRSRVSYDKAYTYEKGYEFSDRLFARPRGGSNGAGARGVGITERQGGEVRTPRTTSRRA